MSCMSAEKMAKKEKQLFFSREMTYISGDQMIGGVSKVVECRYVRFGSITILERVITDYALDSP